MSVNDACLNTPNNPLNQYHPKNPLNPINEYHPTMPFAPLNQPYRSNR